MIDLEALRRIAKGDPDTKITVRRAWLAEVLKEIEKRDGAPKPGFLDRFNEIFGA